MASKSKTSKPKTLPPKILRQGEVNKKILEKRPRQGHEHELLGPYDRYRDENIEIYGNKRKQFIETSKQTRKLNEEALIRSEDYVGFYSEPLLNFDYENPVPPPVRKVPEEGEKIRKRMLRKAHQEFEFDYQPCCLEPWFKRYVTLGKFVQVARKIILYNRLVRNLEILNKVTLQMVDKLEGLHRVCENESYPTLFEKFLITTIAEPKPESTDDLISRMS